MKQRVQIDNLLLLSVILSTVIFFRFPKIYFTNPWFDDVLDFIGLTAILKGTFIRMAARGHKKVHSREGSGLVMTGLYRYVRNPMYLGSFLLGGGFLLMVWPWWMFSIFAVLFYIRFRKQVLLEEKHLHDLFGKTYDDYCRDVPRVFPRWKSLLAMPVREVMPWNEIWSTSERNAFFLWPVLAFFFELLQKKIVFHAVDVGHTFRIFLLTIVIFVAALGFYYRLRKYK